MIQDRFQRRRKRGNERVLIGVVILAAAVLILMRNLGFPFPWYMFTWPMILIVVGLVQGIRDRFTNHNWWVITLVGVFFLATKIYPEFRFSDFFWPVILGAIGIAVLLNRGGRKRGMETDNFIKTDDSFSGTGSFSSATAENISADGELVDAAAVFGSVKKNIYAKNFKGGEVVAVFGGAEINLMNADFTGEIKLEIVNVFGGTTLFVPANWQIRTEAAAILGAIEDKRREPASVTADKVLVLDGFVMFGGIDIKSA